MELDAQNQEYVPVGLSDLSVSVVLTITRFINGLSSLHFREAEEAEDRERAKKSVVEEIALSVFHLLEYSCRLHSVTLSRPPVLNNFILFILYFVDVQCRIDFVDFEGRTDMVSMTTLLAEVNARQLVGCLQDFIYRVAY